MVDRRPARILAMQALCQYEVIEDGILAQLDEFLADESSSPAAATYARELFLWSVRHIEEIDVHISKVAQHWDVKRMSPVDRNVIRVAVSELLHSTDVPHAVAINEAVEIGKAFGTAESGGFINGILDAIVKGLGDPSAANSSASAASSTSETT